MAEAAGPGTKVDLSQLTTPTYARGRLAKLRRDAGGKGSGRCEMARARCGLMSSAHTRPATPRPGASLALWAAWR